PNAWHEAARRCWWPARSGSTRPGSTRMVSISCMSLQSVMFRVNRPKYPGLPKAFLPFQLGFGIVHNTTAHTKNTVLRVMHLYGAYGHVQRAVAIGSQPAYAAAINAARSRFQRLDLLHGRDFGRAG